MSELPKSRLVLLTCVWKRPGLSRVVLRVYRRIQRSLAGQIDLKLLAVGSEGDDSRRLCEDEGFDYIEYPNSPLSHKWNAGVQAARSYDPDGLIFAGSDDLLSSELFKAYAEKLKDGYDFFGLSDLYFFDTQSGRLGYWGGYEHVIPERLGEPIGCGRCFSRNLLDQTVWNLWPSEPGYQSLLDEATLCYVQEKGFQPKTFKLDDINVRAVDIKTDTNINPFNSIHYSAEWNGNKAARYLNEWLSDDEIAALVGD
jgi:hypothetical protein